MQGAGIEWALEDQEELWPTVDFSAVDEVYFEGRYVYSPGLGQFLDRLSVLQQFSGSTTQAAMCNS